MRSNGRRRATVALAISALALAAAVGGPALAGQANKAINGKKIKPGTITSKQIKDGTITAQDLAPGLLKEGPRGPEGLTGPTGPQGATGAAGTNGPEDTARRFNYPIAEKAFGTVAEIGAFKLKAGCQLGEHKFTAGLYWEGGVEPPNVEVFENITSMPAGPPALTATGFKKVNNGIGSNTGSQGGSYHWEVEVRTPSAAISATIWLYANGTDTCKMAARGYLEGDAQALA